MKKIKNEKNIVKTGWCAITFINLHLKPGPLGQGNGNDWDSAIFKVTNLSVTLSYSPPNIPMHELNVLYLFIYLFIYLWFLLYVKKGQI